MEILCIHHRLVFGVQYLKKQIVGPLFEKEITVENYLNLVTQFFALLEAKVTGFSKLGEHPYCKNNNSCLAGLLQ